VSKLQSRRKMRRRTEKRRKIEQKGGEPNRTHLYWKFSFIFDKNHLDIFVSKSFTNRPPKHHGK
jgi:hypothetical protein